MYSIIYNYEYNIYYYYYIYILLYIYSYIDQLYPDFSPIFQVELKPASATSRALRGGSSRFYSPDFVRAELRQCKLARCLHVLVDAESIENWDLTSPDLTKLSNMGFDYDF